MASPAIGGGSPRVPSQPRVPEVVVDPIFPNPGKGRKKVKIPKPRSPREGFVYIPKDQGRMRNVGGIKRGTPGAKMVDRLYNTY